MSSGLSAHLSTQAQQTTRAYRQRVLLHVRGDQLHGTHHKSLSAALAGEDRLAAFFLDEGHYPGGSASRGSGDGRRLHWRRCGRRRGNAGEDLDLVEVDSLATNIGKQQRRVCKRVGFSKSYNRVLAMQQRGAICRLKYNIPVY